MADQPLLRHARTRSPSQLLQLLFRRHFSPYRAYLRRDLRMVVVLNPKVATTTFRKVLLDALQVTQTRPQLGRIWPFDYSRRHLFSPPADYFDLFLHPRRYRFSCFVRNPYFRLLSAWRDKFRLDVNGMPAARSMSRELPAIRRFARARNLAGAGHGVDVPFATFVEYVESQKEGARNHHWDSQCSVLATDLVDYDDVYRIETELVRGMSQIFSGFGLPEEWLSGRLARPLNKSDRTVAQVYTSDLADRVYRLYRSDFEQFGYDHNSWRQLSPDLQETP